MSINIKQIFCNSMEWNLALKNREDIENKPALYVLASKKLFGRLYGKSSVLYIGSTGQLGGKSASSRLRIYRYPNGKHAKELRKRCKQYESKGNKIVLYWVQKKSKNMATRAESKLLKDIEKEHGEIPPFNSLG